MTGASTVELDYCRELAIVHGNLFEFTSRFLPVEKRERLLAVYALKQLILSIPHTPVDDSVKWAKLKWWSDELAAEPDSPSRHPVLRALWASGVRNCLDNSLLQRLVGDAVMQIDATPDSDEDVMFERISDFGVTEIELELAVDGAEIDSHSLPYLGAASSLFAVIAGFGPGHRSGFEQIPLNLLAKFNVSRSGLEQAPYSAEFKQIVSCLVESSMEWFSAGMSGLEIRAGDGACHHLQLRWAMEKRQLAMIRKDVGGFLETGIRHGPADAWYAWRFLRRLK